MTGEDYFDVLGSIVAQDTDLLDSRAYDAVLRRMSFSYDGREGVMDEAVLYLDSKILEPRFIDAGQDDVPAGELYKAYHPERDMEMLEDLGEGAAPEWDFLSSVTSAGVNVLPERYRERNFTGSIAVQDEDILVDPDFERFFQDIFDVAPSELARIEEL